MVFGVALALFGSPTAIVAQPAPAAAPADLFAGETRDPYELAMRAYVWGYPLVRAAQIRQNTTSPDDPFRARLATVAGAPINRIGHARQLASPETKLGVAPNNDTLYSLAWLDLNDGPFVLETPEFGRRYYTFQMGQADSSTDISLGQRTHGARLPPVFIRGPDYRGAIPRGMVEVRSRQRYLMIAGRILAQEDDDLPAVYALQQQVRLRRWADYQTNREVEAPVSPQRPLLGPNASGDPGLRFLEMLGNVLRDWRTPASEQRLVRSFARIGLDERNGFDARHLSPETLQRISAGVAEAERRVRAKTVELGTRVNGWAVNFGGSIFGPDYLLRAAVAMDQIYVLPAEEALYPSARTDARGRELDGRRNYTIRFSKDQLPPVDAFWSITVYYAKGFLVANPASRYAIGDRTPGLTRTADGTLEIKLRHEPPADGASNWLPTPNEPFMLIMRLYRPRPEARNGVWSPPAVQPNPAP